MAETETDLQPNSPSPPSSPDSPAAEFEEEEDPVRICNESIVIRLGWFSKVLEF